METHPVLLTSRRAFLSAALGAFPAAAASGLSRSGIEAEIRRRAEQHLAQRYLVVDYYRIRRKLAYALPVASLSLPAVPVPSIAEYPWATWMTWALEERVNALGWAAEWFRDGRFAAAAARDLEALAGWPKYCQYRQPDLSSGHAGRLLWTAYTKWRWPDASLRRKIREACARHAAEVSPLVDSYYGPLKSRQDFLVQPAPHAKLVNIPLIGTLAAALTAGVAERRDVESLNGRGAAVMGAILELREKGLTEAVAYDGYILDFAADWLESLRQGQRKPVLDHPRFRDYLDECYMLAAPGAMEEVANLSDVEPREMPFHYSAQAKLARLQPDPVRSWYLSRWRLSWIRANALGALGPVADTLRGTAPEAGALNARYAAVLRTGWEETDLAVAMSCSTSPMGHLQNDNGTLMIGTRGRWIISDPGYQQYMRDSERDYTIGTAAHNHPVINGFAQNSKQGRLLVLGREAPDLLRARVELTACYPRETGIRSVTRDVWMIGREGVVVADQIRGEVKAISYHWHGHPDAAWWHREGWYLLHLPETDLWFTSPQARLGQESIQRLPGSRGQLTAVVEADPTQPVIWWAFAISTAVPRLETEDGGRAVGFLGKRLAV